MKFGKLLLISGLAVCICFTYVQRDNLKIIWNEYRTLHKSYCFDKNDWPTPRIPAIKERIAKIDPEAAAIVNYILKSMSRADEQVLDILSGNIFKFPENQYFIYELAVCTSCHLEDGLDPAILLKLANRLIELDSKNSNYYYLKAYALLRLREDNNFDNVIEAIKQAENCEYCKAPYSIYKDRVIAIAKKQGLHDNLINQLSFEEQYSFFVRDIYETLLHYQNLLITERSFARADEISDILNRMLKDNMYPKMMHNLTGYPSYVYNLGGGFGHWRLPQEVDLQRRNLTRPEADQKRMQMCVMANPEKKVKSTYKDYVQNENDICTIAAMPFIYLVRIVSVFIFPAIFFSACSLLRKDDLKNKITVPVIIRFLIYGFVYFLAGQFLIVEEIFFRPLFGCLHINYTDIFFMPPFLYKTDLSDIRDLFDVPSAFLFVFTIPLIIVFCMAVLKFFKPKLDNLITRFIGGILISMPLGIMTTVLQGHTYIKYLPVMLFALFAFKYSFAKITFRDIFKAVIGNSKNDTPALRTNLLKLSVISVLLCWLCILLLAYPVKKSMQKEEKDVELYTYSFTNDYNKAYRDISARIDDVNLPMQNVMRCIPLIKSADLPEVMQKLKNRKYPSCWTLSLPGFCPPGTKEYNTLDERTITFLLMTAGRDQMPIIINYLDNPDNGMALVFRAKLGDKSVKGKLEKMLESMAKDSNQPQAEQESTYDLLKPRESQVVFALSCISEPNDAFKLITDFYKRRCVNEMYFSFEFENVCTLPKEIILKIYNFYLDDLENKIKESDNKENYFHLSPFLGEAKGLYLDNKTAARILSLFLQMQSPAEQIGRLGIEYYLAGNDAALLKKGLQSNNGNLRAWCLRQLKKINYKWGKDELKKIAEDKSWKVKANLSLIDRALIQENELSEYIKLIKSM